MRKSVVIFLVMVFVITIGLSFVGCNDSGNEENITVIDMEGKEVIIPVNVSKVACISQSATDLMIAFGLGDKVVGTYRSFTYNPWAIELYKNAENFKAYSYSVSAEELLADGIELIITQNTENAESFRNAGIPVVAVHQYSPTKAFDEEVYAVAKILGDIFGGEAKIKADAWIQEVRDTISDIKLALGSNYSDNAVYYINGEKSKGLFYSDGGNSMISRILDVANVRLATENYSVINVHNVSDEEMIRLNPYAMIIGGAYQNILADALTESTVWSALDCYTSGRVYRIPVAMVGIENVCAETPVMLKYIANLFWQDKFNFDIKVEMKENIKKHFGYELTDDDVENMCVGLTKAGESMVDAN